MSRETAEALWGSDVVQRALDEPIIERVSAALVEEMRRHAVPSIETPESFARWALSLPWARFCAIVRLVEGSTLEEMLGER